MDATAEVGRNPVSKHQIQPDCEIEQADAGRDCRTRLTRPNSQVLIFPVWLTTSRIGNLTLLILTLAICDDHTYMHQLFYQDRVQMHLPSGVVGLTLWVMICEC